MGATQPLDRIFDALRHPARRQILVRLLGPAEGPPADVDVAALERDDDIASSPLELHHVHLPKLDAVGYIEWVQRTQTVRRGPNFDEVAPVLRLLSDHRTDLPDEWP